MKPIQGYVRVSTQEQSDEGYSIDAQKARIEQYCKFHNLTLGGIIEDRAVSGSVDLNKREGGSLLLSLIRSKQCGGVVAVKLDRIFRSAVDALWTIDHWDKKGVSLHLIDFGGSAIDTGSAMGRMFLTMMAGFAEFERRIIGERTSATMQHMKRKGLYTGGESPYGMQLVDGKLIAHPEEKAVVAKIRAMRLRGVSMRCISAQLARDGIVSRKGKPLNPTQVMRIIHS